MSLTTAQLITLKAAIAAEVNSVFVALRQANDETGMADWYNAAGTFVVWKSNVTVTQVGDSIVGTELAGLTSLNITRLQTIVLLSPAGVNPALADRRAFFDDVFSGAGGVLTRAKLLALWKRFAKRGERVFATGTGTDTVPGLLTFEGNLTAQDISDALRA